MSKSTIPLPKVGGGHKLFGLFVLVLVVWFVVRDPHGAAAAVRAIGRGLGRVADSVTTFFRSL